MNILMLAPEPFFQPRGTPISVYFRLKALADLGHVVTLITYPLGEDVGFQGLTIRRVPNLLGRKSIKIGPSFAKLPLDVLMALRTFGALARRRYDLIFSHEEAGWFGAALGRLFRIPHLYDMHSSLPQQLDNFAFSRSALLKKTFVDLERYVLGHSRAVIVICRALLDYVTAKGYSSKAVFLENFLDFNDFETQPVDPGNLAQIRSNVAPRGEKIVLYAGNFEPYQGIPLLVEAFALVRADARLLIVGGSKSDHAALRGKTAELGIADRVVFVEKVSPASVPLYIAAADVLVSPRVSGTNTPLKIYSFLKSGKPLVATDLWTHTQVLNKKIAVLAKPDPAGLAAGLVFALENEEARRRAGEAKRLADRNYVYPAYLNKMAEALRKAAE
jgi:glycosyltransferase involved in cell wall biosynthesis